MANKLTPTEKENKKKRDLLNRHCNRIEMQFQFKNIKTWSDVYKFTSVPADATPEHLASEITSPELKNYLKGLKDELEAKLTGSSTTSSVAQPTSTEEIIPATTRVKIVEQPKVETPTPQVTLETEIKPAIIESVTPEEFNDKNDYGCPKSPNEKWFAYWFQKKAVGEAWHGIFTKKHKSQLILSPTGSGKTYMCGGIIRRLIDINYHVGKTFGLVNYLYVTRATVVEQTKRVFRDTFGIGIKDGVEVLNIEQLRSRAGQMWVNEKTRIENGEEVTYWEWRKGIAPCVIFFDECQSLKNGISQQHKIAAALNDLDGVLQFYVSATPFTRVSEAKCFAVSTKKDVTETLGFPSILTNETWPTYAREISGTATDPDEYNEAAVERLIKDLEEYIIRVKGIRPQFDAINKVEMIHFTTQEERDFYNSAWERYLKEKAEAEKAMMSKLGMSDGPMEEGQGGGLSILVSFLKFRMAAEVCRKRYLAERMFDTVTKDGKAAVCALNFKGSIIEIVKILVDEFGVPRNKISLVWGGGQTQLTAKQKAKQKIREQADKLREAGLDADEMLESLDLDEVEDRVLQDLPEHLRLGAQSKEERQKEIDRFQSGKADYCLFTFRAGGVGLSLHHTDELSSVKVRHKESGYAVEEDIPNVPIKPRRLFAAPTYSAIEIVQGLGRCPRLTSLSDTEQFMVFYAGTIEKDVADIVSLKLRCLSKVVKTRERWADIVIGGIDNKSEHMKDVPKEVTGETDDEDYSPLEGESPNESED